MLYVTPYQMCFENIWHQDWADMCILYIQEQIFSPDCGFMWLDLYLALKILFQIYRWHDTQAEFVSTILLKGWNIVDCQNCCAKENSLDVEINPWHRKSRDAREININLTFE